MAPAPLGAVGAAMIALGCAGLIDSFVRFALQGLGTPAPVAPTERLVVTGLYRCVRNPMYVAVLCTIFGQALLFASGPLVLYGAAVWLLFHSFVALYEEPVLRARYGAEYDAFCAAVPRWIPRLRPWYGG
jgi:protein-S-isoprenylcysteine O-methyltransferase Ste14